MSNPGTNSTDTVTVNATIPETLPPIISMVATIFEVDPATLSGSTQLMVDLPCESIDLLELGASLNRHFRVSINDDAAFLRSLRVHVAEANRTGRDAAATVQTAYPHLAATRAEALVAALATQGAVPQLTLGDIATYVSHALNRTPH